MSEPGLGVMGTAVAGGPIAPARPPGLTNRAVACPLLEGIALSGAKGVLVLIAANRNKSS